MAALLGALGACLVLSASPARAATRDPTRPSEGYTYFNRPGATPADHTRDLQTCVGTAMATLPHRGIPPGTKTRADIDSFYSGEFSILATYQARGRAETNLQNCMIVGGWRVMRLDEAQGRALWQADPAEIRRQLADWAGAAAPPGQEVRAFANDAARKGTVLLDLSVLAFPSIHDLATRSLDMGAVPIPRAPALFRTGNPKWRAPALTPDGLGAAPPDAAIVVMIVSGESGQKYDGIEFRRVPSNPYAIPFEEDGRPDQFFPDDKKSLPAGNGRMSVLALPPGKWVFSVRSGLEMCLGAPAFEARAGEVLYLGAFDFGAETLAPDMALDTARSLLALAPTLAARLKPAAWTNGATWPCHPLFPFYAITFKGFPNAPKAAPPPAPPIPPDQRATFRLEVF
ncbi:MAG: hypothetical protein V4597_08170 [Pseudomonadota bacterium]